MDKYVHVGRLMRPKKFTMADYVLNDEQEQLLEALLLDMEEADNILKKTIRAQYWIKRIWDTGRGIG